MVVMIILRIGNRGLGRPVGWDWQFADGQKGRSSKPSANWIVGRAGDLMLGAAIHGKQRVGEFERLAGSCRRKAWEKLSRKQPPGLEIKF